MVGPGSLDDSMSRVKTKDKEFILWVSPLKLGACDSLIVKPVIDCSFRRVIVFHLLDGEPKPLKPSTHNLAVVNYRLYVGLAVRYSAAHNDQGDTGNSLEWHLFFDG
jgi:hypothetical protein